MDDQALNEAVARARHPWDETKCRVCGWPIVADGEPGCWQSNCSMRPPPAKQADTPADICSDPAAWGALLTELKAGGSVSLSYIEERGQWFATVTREPAIYSGWDAEQPGRALAMAFLGSEGVEP